MSGHSLHYVAANLTGLTGAALEAVISVKMRPDALVGESRAEEPALDEPRRASAFPGGLKPGLGPYGTCPEGHDVGHVF